MTSPDRRCRALARSTGQQCARAAIPGGTVCAMHGGNAPQTRAAAARRLEQQQIERRARDLAGPAPMTLPEVYDELSLTARMMTAWRDKLADLVDEPDTATLDRAKIYGQMLTATLRGLEVIARLDLDTRRAALSRDQAAILAGAIDRSLGAGDLTPEQVQRVHAALADELRDLDASETAR